MTIKKYDYRCPHCGRLAFRAYLAPDTLLAHRCAKCGRMLTFNSNGKKINITTEEKETKKETAVERAPKDAADIR